MTTGNDAILAANYASGNEITLLIDSLPTVTQQEYKQLLKLAKAYIHYPPGVMISAGRPYIIVSLKEEGSLGSIPYVVFSLNDFVTKEGMSEWVIGSDSKQLYLFLKGLPYTKAEWEKKVKKEYNAELRAWKRDKIDYAKMKQVILNDWPSFVGDSDLFVKFSINNRIYIVMK